MSEGYIKLHRSIQEHWLWKKFPFSEGQAWIDLIMLANHEDVKTPYKGEVIVCERGTVNRSISSLAERWRWSRDKTRRFLSLLENDGMVVVNATTNRTTITLVNYDNFQIMPTTDNATSRQRVRQRADTNNNEKNDNKILPKGNIKHFESERLNKTFLDYIQHRKQLKSPMTDNAIELAKKKLLAMSTDEKEQIMILEQSIREGWKGLFPLKKEGACYGKPDSRNPEVDTTPGAYGGIECN